MARQQRLIEVDEPPVEAVTEEITYVPGQADPVSILWCGHRFQANVPKSITGKADGTNAERLNHHLIESARNNRHFTVGGQRKRRDPAALPTTAEGYRAYMVEWLKDPAIQHAEDLVVRFVKDRELQAVCEVGTDDYSYLSTLFMPKLYELARADDDMTPLQVAALWARHGVNQLPW